MPGLTTGTLHGKLGIRAGNTGPDQLRQRARSRPRTAIGEEGEGFLIAMSAIDQGRYTVAAGAVGLAQACLDASVRYAHERQTFGEEIGRHQLVKQMIAKMGAGHRDRAAARVAGRLAEEPRAGATPARRRSPSGSPPSTPSQSALDAIQIHGAYGYSNEYPVERYLRNSKAAVIYEGTSQIHTLIQADYALGYREDKPLRCEPWPAQGFKRRLKRTRGEPAKSHGVRTPRPATLNRSCVSGIAVRTVQQRRKRNRRRHGTWRLWKRFRDEGARETVPGARCMGMPVLRRLFGVRVGRIGPVTFTAGSVGGRTGARGSSR